jgi:pimeloyl-ACP methyl ester carboxylesterase
VVWYLARRIEHSVFRAVPGRTEPYDLEVVGLTPRSVVLRAGDRAAYRSLRDPGVYGLVYDTGYGHVEAVLADDPRSKQVERRFTRVLGDPPSVGARARIDSFAYPLNPHVAHGLVWEEASVEASQGIAPAWLIPADPRRWAVLVHGKGARREEALRVLPLLHREGWSALAITYRNDVECGLSGCYTYGATEWEDLEAAANLAVARGAREILLVGYSMGGAIVLSFLNRSPLSELVRGLVLDAPMTDLRTLLRLRGRRMRIPSAVLARAMHRAMRHALPGWEETDYHSGFSRINLPVLLFHGDADDVIPVVLSDTFAAGRENVTYHRVPSAGHVRSWNVDRDRYEAAIHDFLATLRPVAAAPSACQSASLSDGPLPLP